MTRRLLMVLVLGRRAGAGGLRQQGRDAHGGETEGLYIDVGELKYQVQISRIINPYDIEDRNYLRGLPEGTLPPKADEAWFGVWLRVENTNDKQVARRPPADFEIVDTQENVSSRSTQLRGQRLRLQPADSSGPKRGRCRTPSQPAGSRPDPGLAARCSSSPTTSLQNRPLSSGSPARRTRPTSASSTSTSTAESFTAAWMTVLAAGAAVSPPAPWPTSSTATATRGCA